MNILGWSFFRDACIINLSHKYESSFKSPFYLFLTIDLVFHKPKIIFFFFLLYTKHFFFLIKSWFLHFTNRSYFLQTKSYLFILIHKTDLNILFKKKTSFIRKKILNYFLSNVCHVCSTYHSTSCKKGYIGH